MQRTETTADFTYDEELMTELLLAYQSAMKVTITEEGALGVLQAYKDMKIAQMHAATDMGYVIMGGDPEG